MKFGSKAASFTVDGDGKSSAIAPAGSGTVDVTVTTPGGTSAPGVADRFTYTSPSTPEVTRALPTVRVTPPEVRSSTRAVLSGAVDPQGLSTTARFEYGLESRYPAHGDVIYDHSTPAVQVGSDFSTHGLSASVSGLVPNAEYYVGLTASNSAGTTYGPDQPFRTAKDPAPLPPVLGKAETAKPVRGPVFVLKGNRLIPLTEARQNARVNAMLERRAALDHAGGDAA